jgi:hypothetical protein
MCLFRVCAPILVFQEEKLIMFGEGGGGSFFLREHINTPSGNTQKLYKKDCV